jgi:hypothetical protein
MIGICADMQLSGSLAFQGNPKVAISRYVPPRISMVSDKMK